MAQPEHELIAAIDASLAADGYTFVLRSGTSEADLEIGEVAFSTARGRVAAGVVELQHLRRDGSLTNPVYLTSSAFIGPSMAFGNDSYRCFDRNTSPTLDPIRMLSIIREHAHSVARHEDGSLTFEISSEIEFAPRGVARLSQGRVSRIALMYSTDPGIIDITDIDTYSEFAVPIDLPIDCN